MKRRFTDADVPAEEGQAKDRGVGVIHGLKYLLIAPLVWVLHIGSFRR